METKRCAACLEVKPLSEFYRPRLSRMHSYEARCKECMKAHKQGVEYERSCWKCGSSFISLNPHASREVCPACQLEKRNERNGLKRQKYQMRNGWSPVVTATVPDLDVCLSCYNYRLCGMAKPDYIPPCLPSSDDYSERLNEQIRQYKEAELCTP